VRNNLITAIIIGTVVFVQTDFLLSQDNSANDIYKNFKKLKNLEERGLIDKDGIPLNNKGCEEYKRILNIDMPCEELIIEMKRQMKVVENLRKKGLLDEYNIPLGKEGMMELKKEGIYSENYNIGIEIQLQKVRSILRGPNGRSNLKNLKIAAKMLKKLIRIDSKKASAFFVLGNTFYDMSLLSRKSQKEFQFKAEKYWNKAIELQPIYKYTIDFSRKSMYSHVFPETEGEKQKRLKKEEAEKYLDKGDEHMLYGINLSSSTKYYNAAVECFDKAIELDPDNPDGYISLGIAYDKLKKHSKAEVAFKKALKRSTEAEDINRVRIFLAEEYKKQGKIKKAVKEYRKILEQDPNNDGAKEGLRKLKVQ